jgi:hypothetical protein
MGVGLLGGGCKRETRGFWCRVRCQARSGWKPDRHGVAHWLSRLSACILASCCIRLLAVLTGSAPHAWQIQKNSTTSTRRSPSSSRPIRLCSRPSFLASCLWVSRACWRSFTKASRTRWLCCVWIVFFMPAYCEQIVLASKMRADVFCSQHGRPR